MIKIVHKTMTLAEAEAYCNARPEQILLITHDWGWYVIYSAA